MVDSSAYRNIPKRIWTPPRLDRYVFLNLTEEEIERMVGKSTEWKGERGFVENQGNRYFEIP